MKGSVRNRRHQREARGRVEWGSQMGGTRKDGGSKKREQRSDESQDEEKLGKCGDGDKKKNCG